MVHRCCRRRLWEKCLPLVATSFLALLCLWWHRAKVMHGVHFLSSSAYRECVHRRSAYSSEAGVVSDTSRPYYVTTAYHGRLGNWLYQYASLLGIAEANGFTPYFLTDHILNYYFQLSHLQSSSAECLVTIEDLKPLSYVESFSHLPKSNVTLDGYFQSWKYFQPIEDKIRQEFRLKDEIHLRVRKKFDDLVGKYVQSGREVISIHVRRGDVTTSGAKRLGFKPAPALYFSNAIRYMVKRHPFSVFLIVTDDPQWCELNIRSVRLRLRKQTGLWNESSGGEIVVLSRDDANGDDKAEFEFVTSRKNIKSLLLDHQKDESSMKTEGEEEVDLNLGLVPLLMAPMDSAILDLGLLSSANHSIISVGTFGWWGAYLAGGEVVYYDDFLIPDHAVYFQWTKGDFHPPEWVAVSAGSRIQWRLVGNNSQMVVVFFVAFLYQNCCFQFWC